MSAAVPAAFAAPRSADAWAEELRQDLFGRTLPFWLNHSVDDVNGGFYNCLDEDGGVWDTNKHIWLQGRQCWMLAKVANTYTTEELAGFAAKYSSTYSAPARTKAAGVKPVAMTRDNLIAVARKGVQFLRDHVVRASDGHIYFCLSAEGKPVLMQRKPFSATFMIMALNEVARATGEEALRKEALDLLDRTLGWIRTPGSLGREVLEGAPDHSPLNVPMIILNVIGELALSVPAAERAAFYATEREWCVAEIRKHIIRDKATGAITAVLENVTSTGEADYSSMDGRCINPGHVIEAGWFLLDYAVTSGKDDLKKEALAVIDWAFEAGWDPEDDAHGKGGMIYFKDAEGYTPPQLEWPMKLWWPHNESMIAFAMAYAATGDAGYLSKFDRVARWSYDHLVDRVHGEWFGYADRRGEVTHRFKGGAYKGCFHVPRCLLMASRLLDAGAAAAAGTAAAASGGSTATA